MSRALLHLAVFCLLTGCVKNKPHPYYVRDNITQLKIVESRTGNVLKADILVKNISKRYLKFSLRCFYAIGRRVVTVERMKEMRMPTETDQRASFALPLLFKIKKIPKLICRILTEKRKQKAIERMVDIIESVRKKK